MKTRHGIRAMVLLVVSILAGLLLSALLPASSAATALRATPTLTRRPASAVTICPCGTNPNGTCQVCWLPPGGGGVGGGTVPVPPPCGGCQTLDPASLRKLFEQDMLEIQRAFPLGEAIAAPGFDPKTQVVLLRYHPESQSVEPIYQGPFADLGDIPESAPGGQYFLATWNGGDYAPGSILENLASPSVAIQAFQLPARVEDVTLETVPAPNAGDLVDFIDAAWDFDRLPGDKITVVWLRDGQTYFQRRTTPFTNLGPFNFLDPDWQGTDLHRPSLLNNLFPGLNDQIPARPLEPGAYTLQIWLNGILEDTTTIEVRH